jgi:hypothetical protein
VKGQGLGPLIGMAMPARSGLNDQNNVEIAGGVKQRRSLAWADPHELPLSTL